MLLAAANLVEQISDHPWPGCQVRLFGLTITWMSSGIASMLLAAVVLLALVIPLARRWQMVPRGGASVLEIVVYFVRDMIARPALHDKADQFMPLILTLFMFILTVNLMGILPLEAISRIIPGMPLVGGVATAIPTVTGALATLSLFTIVYSGLRKHAQLLRENRRWPMWAAAAVSPFLWVRSLSPKVPGIAGAILGIPLALLELAGMLTKCMALMIRLFANMLSGHVLLAVLMMFILQALETEVIRVFYVGPFCIAGSVVLEILELLIAGLQAYIFAFLTAIFLALYVETPH